MAKTPAGNVRIDSFKDEALQLFAANGGVMSVADIAKLSKYKGYSGYGVVGDGQALRSLVAYGMLAFVDMGRRKDFIITQAGKEAAEYLETNRAFLRGKFIIGLLAMDVSHFNEHEKNFKAGVKGWGSFERQKQTYDRFVAKYEEQADKHPVLIEYFEKQAAKMRKALIKRVEYTPEA